MAGYGYTYKGGYTTYIPQTEGWSKTSYTSDHYPGIIDAEGRRKPIISYTPNSSSEYYVTKTEIVEHVPFTIGYKQSTPVRFEVLTEYGDHVEQKWNRTSSPDNWRRTYSPVRYHVEEKRSYSSPVRDRPQQVEDFQTKNKSDPSRPDTKFSPFSATNWRQLNPYEYHMDTGYGPHGHDEGNLSHRDRQKPHGNAIRNEHHDGSQKTDNFIEPTVTTSTWAKPNHGAWSTTQGANLSKATNDINTAVEYLKEAIKPISGNSHSPSRYSISGVSAKPKRDNYAESIDSKEASRRYGNSGLASPRPRDGYTTAIDRYAISDVLTRPKRDNYAESIDRKEASRRDGNSGLASSRPRDGYATSIDSREAARKYGGTTI